MDDLTPNVERSKQLADGRAGLPERFGRYRIVKQLGSGGMGTVYLAEDTQLGRRVALKVPHFTEEDGPSVRQRFLREARSAAAIAHPNICPLHDAGEIDGTLYLTMAYLEGQPLSTLIQEDKPLAPREAAALIRKLALALLEAHARGVIHRDLKPSNIMINQRQEPVIMDFGLARRAQGEEERLTRTGTMIGTPAYIPPEQINGDLGAIGPHSDVYSLGVILYELLTGRRPFDAPSAAVLAQILFEEPKPPSTHRPGLDPALEAICLKAMARRIADRYPNMAEFAGALTEHLRSSAADSSAEALAPAASWRRRSLVAVLVVSLLLLAALPYFLRNKSAPEHLAPAEQDLASASRETEGAASSKRVEKAEAKADKPPDANWIAQATGKAPVPDAQQLAELKKELRDACKVELANPKPEERAKLAKSLLRRADEAGRAQRFALLELASEVAVDAGDYATALQACEQQGKWFLVDVLQRKAAVLTSPRNGLPGNAAECETLAETALTLAYEASALDDYESATRLIPLAKSAAAKAGARALMSQADFLEEECVPAARAFVRVKPFLDALPSKTTNEQAVLEAGKFLALFKKDWAKGASLLARCEDAAWRAVAARELEAPNTRDKQVALADAWWERADKTSGDEALPCRQRARHWYLKAIAATPLDQRGELIQHALPRVDAVPVHPVRLRIRLQGVHGHHRLTISNNGIVHTHSYTVLSMQINHLHWPGTIRNFSNTGSMRLLPEGLDFLTADVTRPASHAWGAMSFRVTAEQFYLEAFNSTGTRIDFSIDVTLQANGFALKNRFSGLWDAKFYTWSGTPPPTGNDWASQTPVQQARLGHLGFRWGDQPPGHAQWGVPFDKVPINRFGLVATSTWNLPAGKYEMFAAADDGVRVFLDDQKLIDLWANKPRKGPTRVEVQLAAGDHPIRIEYYNHEKRALLRFALRRLGEK